MRYPRDEYTDASSHEAPATVSSASTRVPQMVIEKVVQRYALDLPADETVRAGDHVMIHPEHVMTFDNTGLVIHK